MKTSPTAADFDTLSQATQHYNQQGYTDNLTLDAVHRFEGMSNPSDNMILYAITRSEGNKGVAVETYGVDSVILNDDMRKAL
jgi:hypothetical protein